MKIYLDNNVLVDIESGKHSETLSKILCKRKQDSVVSSSYI